MQMGTIRQKLATVALGVGAFASVLASRPDLVVAIDELLPSVAEDSSDATTHNQQGDSWNPPLTAFQRQAILMLHKLATVGGIDVDWSRVDAASTSVLPSDFNFQSGTIIDALNEYMIWTGLLVTEGRTGKLYAMNPNVYESKRNYGQAVFRLQGTSAEMLVQDDGGSWHPIAVTGFSYDIFDQISFDTPLDQIDEGNFAGVRKFLLDLEPGDVVDFSGSSVEAKPRLDGHYQLTGKAFDFRSSRDPSGERYLQSLAFTSSGRMQDMLGHRQGQSRS